MTSPLAKLVTTKSYLPRASMTASATWGRDSSGFWSKSMPLGEGKHRSSSPGKALFSPPLKKKVTWANFSLSAQWNWVFPASLSTWARGFTTLAGAKAMGRSLNLSWYMVMMTKFRSLSFRRSALSKPSSVNISVSSISRSPRRQQKMAASPSPILPTGLPSSTRTMGSRW